MGDYGVGVVASSYVILPVATVQFPSSSPAIMSSVVSSTTATSNTPKVNYEKISFDPSTDQQCMWQFAVPANYVSGGTVTLDWGAAVNSGNVIWVSGLMVATASVNLTTSTYLAADASAATAVPATIGFRQETSIALTTTGMAAGLFCSLFVGRDANAGGDTATGNSELFGAIFSYTS